MLMHIANGGTVLRIFFLPQTMDELLHGRTFNLHSKTPNFKSKSKSNPQTRGRKINRQVHTLAFLQQNLKIWLVVYSPPPTTQNSISVVNHEYHRRRKTTLETQLHLTGKNEGDRETRGTSKKKSKKKKKNSEKNYDGDNGAKEETPSAPRLASLSAISFPASPQ